MKWVGKMWILAPIPIAVCCLLSVGGVAHAGDRPQLSGNWNFNSDQSDDAQQKIQQARQSQQAG